MREILLRSSAFIAVVLAGCGGGNSSSPPVLTPPPAVTSPLIVTSPIATGAALTLAQSFLASLDTIRVSASPATGAARFTQYDGCWLNNGTSKTLGVAEYDAEPQRVARAQFDVGSTRTGISVTAERNTTNSDGSVRREIDVQYTVNYVDGTREESARETLISGSSAGSLMANGQPCTTAENKSDLRFFGNRRVVNTSVIASNDQHFNFASAVSLTGTIPLGVSTTYSRYIALGVRDPAEVATYAIVSGPGLTVSVSGIATPAAFKMVSTRLLRDAPEFAGKPGNFVDWQNNDTWRVCRASTPTGEYARDDIANCTANGAIGRTWGSFNNTSPASLDANFNTLGVVAGGTYTFKIYADDGWKTVNGQLGKTPIATYTSVLQNLPFSTAELVAGGGASNKFPGLATTRTPAELVNAVRGKAAITANLGWTRPAGMPDSRAVGLLDIYSFLQGRTGSGTTANPASRQNSLVYLPVNATSASLAVPAAPAQMVMPISGEIGVEYTNRNGNFINSILSLQ